MLAGDILTIDGLRCVSAERLILDTRLFRFTPEETHNAIDSALRMRLVSEVRLRRRIVNDLPANSWHRATLIDALVDTGGESALERRFLAVVRRAGLQAFPQPPSKSRKIASEGRIGDLTRVSAASGDGL
ncbi:MAG TPA: hypothetical protein VIK05_00545 [Ilumatobacteraceae bacterium]